MAKIHQIEAIPIAIELRQPLHLASEIITKAQNLIVKITDSDGIIGWGEAASAPTMTGETLPGMVEAVKRLIAPALANALIDETRTASATLSSMTGNPGARAAVDVALHDIYGKRAGKPLHELFGVKRHGFLQQIQMLDAHSAEKSLKRADALANEGFTHFKVKVGQSDPAEEAAFVDELRALLGENAHLSADANMAWDVAAARMFLTASQASGLAYLEQPLADGDISGMAQLSATSSLPLCLDEGIHAVSDIEAYDAEGAAKGVGLKLLKLGGFSGTLDAEATARRCGWQTTYASKIAETSLGAAATAHAACLSADVSWGVSLTQHYLREDIALVPLSSSNGIAQVPHEPGLGVEPNLEKLARVRLDH